ncbi:E3 ubiquitin-protein ligase TRIM7-like [Eublepharis macularius]|uniref:E3 ubiquitin-protein ligase TRIM7-like n=1 Tax=Eublepharis macularius TaxID=481883 RepID=A0AA97KWB1_EUBMA|nr:E3 ubiquitin-protein ligase TRIM7-like [Eublepharis macularius]
MAAENPRKRLGDKMPCSTCADCGTVTLYCGHRFCQSCILKCWKDFPAATACPQCQEGLQPKNSKLSRLINEFSLIARKLNDQAKEEAGWKKLCEKHQNPLALFCKDDETPVCEACSRSHNHKEHCMVPLEEAAAEYKDQIYRYLKILKKEREHNLACKLNLEKESHDLLKQTIGDRQNIVTAFKQLCQFLEEQEKFFLSQMEEVEKEIVRKKEKHLATLSRDLSSLESLIWEMEEKIQQPSSKLLQGRISTLQRYEEREKFENLLAFPSELKWRIWNFCDINPFLEGIMKQFRDNLVSGILLQKAEVTLDPDTAHPQLVLSEDRKSVNHGEESQDLPTSLERFVKYFIVLGQEGFTAGRHFWEVNVGSEEGWAVGVARKSVRRKEAITLSPEEGVCAVWMVAGGYVAINPPHNLPLTLSGELKRIQICLNYYEGRVAFFDADTATHLYTFSETSFSGETIFPFFCVFNKGHLSLPS